MEEQHSKVTPRDKIWSQLLKSNKLRWTTKEMVDELDEVSEYTVRDTLNAITQEGILSHKKRSEYWYVDPEYA